ncbi:MAG: HNH endonuclease [Pseudanabaenaceae cyanobacterium]
MAFPPSIAEKALLDCGRCCSICHKFCGFKIELHHIIQKSEGGEDSYENCIPLCLDCHADVKAYNPKHPKGRKYTETELVEHRNRWYEKVRNKNFLLIHPECIELDRKVFLKIKQILPTTDGAITFIRNHVYNTPWLLENHKDLEKYRLQCQNPDFEFIDLDLEIHRCKLTELIEEFFNKLYAVSFPTDRFETTYLEIAVYPDIKYSKPDVYYEAVKDVDQLANNVCSAYDSLIRLGRRKLGVD